MKKLHTIIAYLVLVGNSHSTPAEQEEFIEAPPIIWRETLVAVSPAPTQYLIRYTVGSSCEKLYELQQIHADVASATQFCNTVFMNQIVNRFRKFASGTISQTGPNPPQLIRNSGQHQATQPSQPVVPQQITKTATNRILNTRDVIRNKRQWQLPMLFGAFVSNIWSTYMVSNANTRANVELHKELASAHSKIQEINASTNSTLMELRATQELDEIQTKLLKDHIHTTEKYITGTTVLTLVTSDLISRMHLIGSYLEMIHNSIIAKRLDLPYLSLLIGNNFLQDLDASNIERDSLKFVVHNDYSFTLEFVGRRHSLDTRVYGVKSFKHWGSLVSDSPTYYEYRGPSLILYNRTSNCLKGLDEVIGNYVIAKCTEPGYEDKRLWDWKVQDNGSPLGRTVETQTISGWPWVYIYCFPGSIRLEEGRVAKCPPHPFQLDAMRAWSTDDYGQYLPSAIQIVGVANLNLTITKVHNSHFRNGSHFFTLTEAKGRVRRLREEVFVMRDQGVLTINQHSITLGSLFLMTLVTLTIILTYRIYHSTLVLKNRVKIDKARATLERRRSAQALSQQLYDVVVSPTGRARQISSNRLSIIGSADGTGLEGGMRGGSA